MAEEFEEDYEESLIEFGVLDLLNCKIVPKQPGDSSYNQFNNVIPPESRLYAAEYVRLQCLYNKMKEKMTAMSSSSELEVREDLIETQEALARERKVVEEAKCREKESRQVDEELQKRNEEMRKKLIDLLAELEETKTKSSTQQIRLVESEKVISALRKVADKVTGLQSRLREKSSEVEYFQRDLNNEREEKSRMQTKLTSCEESLQIFNLALGQFVEKLKNSLDYDDGVDTIQPNSQQSKLESLSAHIQSLLKAREVTVKKLQVELAKSKETIKAKNEQLRKQSDEINRLTVAPLSPPSAARREILSPPPTTPNSDLPHPQSSVVDNIAVSVTRSPMLEASTATSSVNLIPDMASSSEATHLIIDTGIGDSDSIARRENDDDTTEKSTLFRCRRRKCEGKFPTWADYYQHQKTIHTVQMSKKIVQRRARATPAKKKEAEGIPKIKFKLQRKTRSGALWKRMAQSPQPI